MSPARAPRAPVIRYRPARRTDVETLAELGARAYRVSSVEKRREFYTDHPRFGLRDVRVAELEPTRRPGRSRFGIARPSAAGLFTARGPPERADVEPAAQQDDPGSAAVVAGAPELLQDLGVELQEAEGAPRVADAALDGVHDLGERGADDDAENHHDGHRQPELARRGIQRGQADMNRAARSRRLRRDGDRAGRAVLHAAESHGALLERHNAGRDSDGSVSIERIGNCERRCERLPAAHRQPDRRDLLIGGLGADRLVGNDDDDILIAGTTAWDNNEEALCHIMKEWSRTDLSYEERVEHLRSGGGLNGATLLNLSTVASDGVANRLSAQDDLDSFFANLLDSTDLDPLLEQQVTT